jgi:uncharacterized protein
MSMVLFMKPSDCVKLHRIDVLNIASSFGASNVRDFGSALHGTDIEGSDLDLLVDLLTPKDLPTSFRNAVLLEAQPL